MTKDTYQREYQNENQDKQHIISIVRLHQDICLSTIFLMSYVDVDGFVLNFEIYLWFFIYIITEEHHVYLFEPKVVFVYALDDV